ncbi:MAG: thiamine diphosphokinase [Chloroflexota bacterium]|nr:thiamine diphosphokinase [Chloroflexota bacterium]
MRIIIFANGKLAAPAAEAARWVHPTDVIVAADGGMRHVLAAGLTPDQIIGDLDSLPAGLRVRLKAAGATFQIHPPAKDETDLELTLLWAAMQETDAIIVLGALGGRPDQELANLLLLALPELAGRAVSIAAGAWQIRLIRGGETLALHGEPGDTVSLIPLGGDARGITTDGLRYPLRQGTLRCGPARGVSNMLAERTATVMLEEGLLWCFQQIHRE